MDVFIDAFYDPDGGDPWTHELNNVEINSPELYKAMFEMIDIVPEETNHAVEYFEIWDKNSETDEPAASYDPDDVIKTYMNGIARLKSIWTYRR